MFDAGPFWDSDSSEIVQESEDINKTDLEEKGEGTNDLETTKVTLLI